MDDQLMTIKQLADYLNLNDRTVLKLVTEGTLPGLKVGSQWRFRKAMIDTWLDDQILGVTPKLVERIEKNGQKTSTSKASRLDISHCFQPEHIITELRFRTKNAIIEELAGLAGDLGLIADKTWFVGALIERENIMPSAMGNGVAFLHTMRRNPQQVARPFMILGRSLEGVDFDSLDGNPTHLIFVLGLKFDDLELPWLSSLSQMLADRKTIETVLRAKDAESVFNALVVN